MAAASKVAEDLSEDVAAVLRAAGLDAKSVNQQGWQGKKDPQLWPELQKEGRALVTGDKGFSSLATHPPHHGVVLLRPERESRAAFCRLMQLAIDSGLLDDLADTLVVVTDGRVRSRKMR